jgi:hypothetical protein
MEREYYLYTVSARQAEKQFDVMQEIDVIG